MSETNKLLMLIINKSKQKVIVTYILGRMVFWVIFIKYIGRVEQFWNKVIMWNKGKFRW